MERFSRTQLLIGADGLQKLHNAKVAVFGVGGVGGYVVEALARSGVGGLTLIDPDRVSESNINRQIIALSSTVGQYKTHAAKARVMDIHPDCKVETLEIFYSPDVTDFDFSPFDYVVDAVDTVSAKLAIIERAKNANIPVISSMGAGNKLDPTLFEVSDIAKTSVCPLARVMRRELKKRGIDHVKVVYSKEEPLPARAVDEESGKAIPASIAFVPSVVGLIIAAEVVKDLIA
ncbi:MAG: tRNA threonylcarbamoyladenosine dehydratase [Clostridiales bacterium]|nr:tRNA threonylcarbamoyladenosine dehydratase [Clostridiales bacterium]